MSDIFIFPTVAQTNDVSVHKYNIVGCAIYYFYIHAYARHKVIANEGESVWQTNLTATIIIIRS